MSKGLEATKRLKWGYAISREERINLCECIEKELKDKEKKDKALEIIKNKRVNCFDVIDSIDYKHYLVLMEEYHKSWRLTKQEYKLLKEVLL